MDGGPLDFTYTGLWSILHACRFRDKLAQRERDLSTKQHKWVFTILWKILCMQPPCRVYGSWERGEEETDWTEKSRCGVERSETFFRFPPERNSLALSLCSLARTKCHKCPLANHYGSHIPLTQSVRLGKKRLDEIATRLSIQIWGHRL